MAELPAIDQFSPDFGHCALSKKTVSGREEVLVAEGVQLVCGSDGAHGTRSTWRHEDTE